MQDPNACQQQDYKVWTQDPFAGNCFGYRKFVKRKLIKKEQHGFLKDDSILITYRMELFISDSVPSKPSLQLEVNHLVLKFITMQCSSRALPSFR